MNILIWLVSFLTSASAWALSSSISFTNPSIAESKTLVFNQELQALHPTLIVTGYRAPAPPAYNFDVGQGQEGAFNSNTYSQFSVGGNLSGNVIRIDTDTFPELRVTQFELEAGWAIEPEGSKPLIIKSLSDVIIAGEIRCNGGDGQDAVGATPGLGGQGRCGGANGGDGGLPNNDATNGMDVHPSVTGGIGGNFTGGAAVGGGGGGSWNTLSLPGAGPNVNVGGGQAGTSTSDPELLNMLGSAGGGGGSGNTTDAGAGGGAGGGLVVIYAVRDFILGQAPSSVIGEINVSGGNGGSSNVPGGPGGGGGGGSVQVFAGRNIEIYNTNGSGASRANSGQGGSNSLAVVGANGGLGRSWYSSVGYNLSGTGFYTPAEQLPLIPGQVEFSQSAQQLVSTSVDLRATLTQVTGVQTTPVSADYLVEIAGSDDNFLTDDTGFTTNFSLLKNKRYIKARIVITNTNATNPSFLTAVSIQYDAGPIEEFDLVAAGCGRVNTHSTFPWGSLLLLVFPLIFAVVLKAPTQKQQTINLVGG